MRPLRLSWLLIACACSTPNPLFELMTEVVADSTGPGESSTDAPPTSSASATTGVDGTTGVMGETTSQPTAPDTGMADATSDVTSDATTDPPGTSTQATSGSESGDEWVCEPMINGFAQNIPRVIMTDEPWTECDKMQQPFQTLIGHGAMTAMGELHFVPGQCAIQDDNFTIEFGEGYPAPARSFCGRLRIVWAADDPGCKIAAFTLEEFDADNQSLGYLYGLYHSPAVLPPGLPYTPKLAAEGSCGCPNILEKCCPEEPGQHSLLVLNEPVAPGDTTMIGGLLFTNWNANIWPECIENPDKPPRIDWFGARVD